MFYLSHPNDIRPDTRREGGGGGADVLRNGRISVPDSDMLSVEREKVAGLARDTKSITLEVERVLFTRLGTLLVVFKDVK